MTLSHRQSERDPELVGEGDVIPLGTCAELQPKSLRRWVYQVLGCLCVGLGILGAFLPLLPTTPFLLLASYLFFRSSPTLYRKLYHSPVAGDLLKKWEREKGVSTFVKCGAIGVVACSVGLTLYFSGLYFPLKVMVVFLALIGIGVILSLPSPQVSSEEPRSDESHPHLSATSKAESA